MPSLLKLETSSAVLVLHYFDASKQYHAIRSRCGDERVNTTLTTASRTTTPTTEATAKPRQTDHVSFPSRPPSNPILDCSAR